MKQLFLILGFICILFSACGNDANNNAPTTAPTATVADSTATTTDNFYKRLEGTIAGKAIVMHLHKTGNSYDGQYSYDATGMPINLMLDSMNKDSLYFSEYVQANNWDESNEALYPKIHLAKTTNALNGVWISGDGKKSFPITLTENYPDGSYPFDMLLITDSIKAFMDKPKSPMAHCSYNFVVPKNNEWIATEVRKELGFSNDMLSMDYKTGVANLNKAYFKQYQTEVAELGTNFQDDSPSMSYEQMVNIAVRYNQDYFVVLESSEYAFTGGAHGNYYSTLNCLDVKTQKKLSLKDVITADSATLQPIVERFFRKQYHVTADSLNTVLFENYLAANDNFYFTNKGIGFLYNPYEIASYAQGQINVFIPFTAIDKYLVPSFRARLQP